MHRKARVLYCIREPFCLLTFFTLKFYCYYSICGLQTGCYFHIRFCHKGSLIKYRIGAVFCAVSLLFGGIYPQQVWADDKFRNKDFLALNDHEKRAWVNATVVTLAHIAAVQDKSMGQCISKWYYSDMSTANDLIIRSMKAYPDAQPSAIFFALTERECGKYIHRTKPS